MGSLLVMTNNIDRMRTLAGIHEEDNNKREVTIPYYGVMRRDQLIDSVQENIEHIVTQVERDNWEGVMYALTNSVLTAKVQALIDTNQEDPEL
jgi:hypothetical protein